MLCSDVVVVAAAAAAVVVVVVVVTQFRYMSCSIHYNSFR